MRDILIGDEQYSYLSGDCKKRLEQIRDVAKQSGITGNIITPLSSRKYAIYPWLGTRQLSALFFALEQKGIKCSVQPGGFIPVYLEADFDNSFGVLEQAISEIYSSEVDKHTFALPDNIQVRNKYNNFIPQELLVKQVVKDYVDVTGMKKDLSEVVKLI